MSVVHTSVAKQFEVLSPSLTVAVHEFSTQVLGRPAHPENGRMQWIRALYVRLLETLKPLIDGYRRANSKSICLSYVFDFRAQFDACL